MLCQHSFVLLEPGTDVTENWITCSYVMGIGEAEAFSERLKRELQALEAANVHAIMENEPLIREVVLDFLCDGPLQSIKVFVFINFIYFSLLYFICQKELPPPPPTPHKFFFSSLFENNWYEVLNAAWW